MYKLLSAILIFTISSSAFAQMRDSLFIVPKKDRWFVRHEVKKGEDIFVLAMKYHVPPAALAETNKIGYQTKLKPREVVLIPLDKYNRLLTKPANKEGRALFYKVAEGDNLVKIGRCAGAQQQAIKEWNKLNSDEVLPGQVLFVGWISFDASGTVSRVSDGLAAQSNSDHPAAIKQFPIDLLSNEEKEYLFQTNIEENIVEERGSAVFFGGEGRVKGTEMFFALHGTAPKGTIIKVHNPGAEKTIFVKVIGPLPGTKQYYNSVIGIASGAKVALGAIEEKAWCELKYAPN
jgi:LysM repeat protein